MKVEVKVLLLRISECKTIEELDFVEDLHIKGQFNGMDKVDLQIAYLEKFQELIQFDSCGKLRYNGSVIGIEK